MTTRQETQIPGESYETWRIEIRNTGLGSAIINHAKYVLDIANAKSESHLYTFDNIIKELSKIDLTRDCDYWLENITMGFSLAPKDDCFAFEIKTERIGKLKRFSMVLYFQGQLGDRYCREIFLVPHN